MPDRGRHLFALPRALALAWMLWAAGAATACDTNASRKAAAPPPARQPGQPGPGDSLARLSRRFLTDSNTRAIAQAIICEHMRLGQLYGERRASEIAAEVRETVYTEADEAALRRTESKLANSMFSAECDTTAGAALEQGGRAGGSP
jgi:hypothetical protein